ncbi:hypothetical protein [Nevskia sp.]|uniref:hypothetical protein n=1 Tax=Nevskia sp. TaxID=1929292 RepID=UPI0025DC913E|nr:hypothetical protein [Nevskia sp.]
MPLNSADFLKAQYLVNKALGNRSLASDARIVISGFEHLTVLIKDFTWPVLSPAGEVEVWLPGGQKTWQAQVLETAMQGQITITETVLGHGYDAIHRLNGRNVDCTLFEGSPEAFYRSVKIRDAFLKMDPAERSFESRSQVTQYTGTMFYNFFGETVLGSLVG